MLWLLLAGLAAFFLWTQRGALRLPPVPPRGAAIATLSVFAMLAARSGRLTIAATLGLVALGLMAYWRFEAERTPRAASSAPPPSSKMSVAEAYTVLELSQGASPEEIKQAHRRLMKLAHPDAGGSNHGAARLNAAKDLLLGRG